MKKLSWCTRLLYVVKRILQKLIKLTIEDKAGLGGEKGWTKVPLAISNEEISNEKV